MTSLQLWIAQRIGVTKGVISYHFAGKEALDQAVIADVLAKAVAYMQPRVSVESTGPAVLRAAILSNLAFMGENHDAMIAFFEIAVNTRAIPMAPRLTKPLMNRI